MIKKILSNHILSKSLQTMVVQALGQACAFITAILLARHLNMKDYGFYIFDVTVATIIAVVATMGAGGILARTWGKSDLKSNFERHKETFRVHNWYFKRGFAIVVIVIALIIFYNRSEHSDNSIENFALLFAVPFFMANIFQSFFVARRVVIFANLIQLGLRLIMLFLTLAFIVLYINDTAMLIGTMMIFMTIYVTSIWLIQTSKYSFESAKPVGSNLSFALMQWGLLLLSQIDIIILKGLSDPSNVALFGVALQLSALVSFVLNAVNSNVLSQIADDYKNNSREIFQQKITAYTRIIFVLSIIAILGLIICGYPITLMYGEQYTTSYFIFCILMIGQIVNVLSGCVATILNMAGFEKNTCIAFYIALVLNIVLGSIFTLYWGVYGLAVASSISMIYWNIHLLYKVVTKIKINPTIFIFR
ncbi:lipopolysaccharide biosynthesis protein [Francisella orientalis]|uniref:Multidrug transporter n=1 Tax=Francisella orientalis TaxID=299583 RepID=A0AAP7FT98_9GAMM|nr:polysaccharide biosynthesis C-terminal domain-containing protein [Francisella orientalis]AFJ43653.1 multidrug/oligosaccharidyl-lipid/polysaccharide (MOP) transporter [Francisella orientalis str. Toba 04]AKN85356.1 Multidrug/oligosaccharidyl-lipid/polysaccharide transporter [Francisella orientalis FNO12]AKN86895.1 Multidrug/oligosaccharidyl-lipid/polysaccharide transporter [Francisella orientalis FNO24]AKN88434.1 Multidrug/oligosaccharidyl-lipid/polysaccharide transporter [Francisella orienta